MMATQRRLQDVGPEAMDERSDEEGFVVETEVVQQKQKDGISKIQVFGDWLLVD